MIRRRCVCGHGRDIHCHDIHRRDTRCGAYDRRGFGWKRGKGEASDG